MLFYFPLNHLGVHLAAHLTGRPAACISGAVTGGGGWMGGYPSPPIPLLPSAHRVLHHDRPEQGHPGTRNKQELQKISGLCRRSEAEVGWSGPNDKRRRRWVREGARRGQRRGAGREGSARPSYCEIEGPDFLPSTLAFFFGSWEG